MRGSDGRLIDFSNNESISQLNNQGFTILCSGCSQFINIKFNTESTETTYQKGQNNNDKAVEFVVGIQDFGTTHEEFLERIFEGIQNAADKPTSVTDYKGSSKADKFNDNDDNITLHQRHNLQMARDKDGNYYILKNNDGFRLGIYDQGTYLQQVVMRTIPAVTRDNVIVETQEVEVTPFYETDIEDYVEGNPLWIHHGTKANQRINVYINDMRSKALGINAADVRTREKAVDAIEIIDQAIEYSLNEATNTGAYLQRLEYTEANVTTQDENVQAAESTIRDADMAKEMTEYTKNNVLSQAAQSMLAQANQNLSSVLSLLQ